MGLALNMKNNVIYKPVWHFLISIILFLIFFIGGIFISAVYNLLNSNNLVFLVHIGIIFSIIFSVSSLIGLIKIYRIRKKLKASQIISLIGSCIIIIIFILLGLFLLLLNFPQQIIL